MTPARVSNSACTTARASSAAPGGVGVDREPPPLHAVRPRRQWRQRRPEQCRIRPVDPAVSAIHLLVAVVHDTDGTVRRLEAFAEVEPHLLGRALQLALDAG